MARPVTVTITVDVERGARVGDVAAAVTAAGARVTEILPALGLLTAVADEAARARLATIAGVAAVEDAPDRYTTRG